MRFYAVTKIALILGTSLFTKLGLQAPLPFWNRGWGEGGAYVAS